jgi:tripartite-type tricarboxylate transporter receptor subunit TctC
MTRDRFFTACVALLALVAAGSGNARAQSDYPTRPVRMVVGFGPGSAADLTARLLAQKLSQTMGQPFVVENRGGAGSATSRAKRANGPTSPRAEA